MLEVTGASPTLMSCGGGGGGQCWHDETEREMARVRLRWCGVSPVRRRRGQRGRKMHDDAGIKEEGGGTARCLMTKARSSELLRDERVVEEGEEAEAKLVVVSTWRAVA